MSERYPKVHNFCGFDPTSQTTRVMVASGNCLGEFVPAGAAVTFDTAVAPLSGELAIVMISLAGGNFTAVIKQLEVVDGKWFMLSLDGINEIKPNFEVVGKVVQVVTFGHCPRIDPDEPHVIQGDTLAYREYQARLRATVLPRLARHGFNRKAIYPLSATVASRLPSPDRLS